MMGQRFGYGMMDGTGWIAGLFMLFFGLLVLAGLVLLAIWAVRAAGHGPAAQGPSARYGHDARQDDAIAVVRRRYAAGEITREQYDDLMRGLTG